MKYFFAIAITFLFNLSAKAQFDDFPKVDFKDLIQEKYSIDSNATAVVLIEKGRTFIEGSDTDRSYMIFHNYKIRIKILKQEGFNQANFTIPLYRFGSTFERIQSIKGTTYNALDYKINEVQLEQKNIFNENKSEYLKLAKFTLPNIKVGSIIDIEYTIVSPDFMNFRTWNFQSDIPKLHSDYTVLIPGIYKYNVVLKGALKLKDTKSKLEKQCLAIYNTRVDCSNINYSMDSIPAFQEEDYMLAPKNYMSAIYFELEEAYNAGGSKQSYTKQWKDVDRELLSEKKFGGQIKKNEFIKEKIDPEILKVTDPYLRAQKVYYWIQNNIKWNNYYGKYAQYGVEDALNNKNGNIGDINLALIAALNAADVESFPILVSTRDNGLPHHLHPVISDFNYVIAAARINNEIIQIDASDKLLPFAQLPLRAINGEGRIIYSKKSSEWIPLENKIINSTSYAFDGKLNLDGTIRGTLVITNNGLDAYNRRHEILNYNSLDEYQENLDNRLTGIDIQELKVFFLEETENTLNVELDIILKVGDSIKDGNFQLNPIFLNRLTKNSFNLDERHYPVDLGAKKHESYEINIEMPDGITLINGPKNNSLTLPESSARYIYKSNYENNKLSVIQQTLLNKSIYSTDEYFGLKELYSRIIQQLKIDYTFNYKKHD